MSGVSVLIGMYKTDLSDVQMTRRMSKVVIYNKYNAANYVNYCNTPITILRLYSLKLRLGQRYRHYHTGHARDSFRVWCCADLFTTGKSRPWSIRWPECCNKGTRLRDIWFQLSITSHFSILQIALQMDWKPGCQRSEHGLMSTWIKRRHLFIF